VLKIVKERVQDDLAQSHLNEVGNLGKDGYGNHIWRWLIKHDLDELPVLALGFIHKTIHTRSIEGDQSGCQLSRSQSSEFSPVTSESHAALMDFGQFGSCTRAY
jgi:hypothetical protein